jgi:hypothetical protein
MLLSLYPAFLFRLSLSLSNFALDWTSRPIGQLSCFVFGKSATHWLTEIIFDFPQAFHCAWHKLAGDWFSQHYHCRCLGNSYPLKILLFVRGLCAQPDQHSVSIAECGDSTAQVRSASSVFRPSAGTLTKVSCIIKHEENEEEKAGNFCSWGSLINADDNRGLLLTYNF